MAKQQFKHFRSTTFKWRSLSWDYARKCWALEWNPQAGYWFANPEKDWETLRGNTPDLIEQAEEAGFTWSGPIIMETE